MKKILCLVIITSLICALMVGMFKYGEEKTKQKYNTLIRTYYKEYNGQKPDENADSLILLSDLMTQVYLNKEVQDTTELAHK